MEIKERVAMVLKMNNLTPSEFADRIGVRRSNVSHVLSGRNKPSLDFLEKIVLNFQRVNAYWLITGEVKDREENLVNQKLQTTTDKENALSNVKSKELKIVKIVEFYSDDTFKVYNSSEE